MPKHPRNVVSSNPRHGPPLPEVINAVMVNEFKHRGMRFQTWMTGDWCEVYFWIPGREHYIGMRRERSAYYGPSHVEQLAKEMAERVLPRFTLKEA